MDNEDRKKLVETREELATKQKAVGTAFEEAGVDLDFSKVESLEGDDPAAKIERLRASMKELDGLAIQVELLSGKERADQIDRYINEPAPLFPAPVGGQPEKTLGETVVESETFKAELGKSRKAFKIEDPDWELKTLFQTTAGFLPETTRTGRIAEAALLGVQVLDILPSTPTNQASVVYMEETVTAEAAAERAEAGAYAEAQLSYAEKSSTVRSIGVSLPVTDEQIEDVPGVRGLIDGRLMLFLRRRLDLQVLTGDGIAPNLTGILNVAGIQTQAKGADPVFDAIHKAITKVQVTGAASPDAIVLHPNDWEGIRLKTTNDGVYILGNPSDAGLRRLWGLPVAVSDRITENTGLVGDFAGHSELRPRRGIQIESGFVNTDFTTGKQTLRGGLRTAFVVYRPAAFATVTGI